MCLRGSRRSEPDGTFDRVDADAWNERLIGVDKSALQKLFDLSGRTAIITGGTRGIGSTLAEAFASAGAKVVVAGRDPETCDETEARLRGLGADALGVPTRLGRVEELQALVDTTVDRFGGIDIVVNNAAGALAQRLGKMTPDAFDKSRKPSASGWSSRSSMSTTCSSGRWPRSRRSHGIPRSRCG